MNASKENCQEMIQLLEERQATIGEPFYSTLMGFLKTALRQLPKEEAFPSPKNKETA